MTEADTGRGALGATSVPLVDRERELAELDAALQEARTRRGRVYLIAGEPGIGKTRLAEAVAERGAASNMLALWGRAWETGGAPLYWPWLQALRTLVAERDAADLERELGAGARWLVPLLPELQERLPDVEPPRAADTESARFALFDAVAAFLGRAAAATPLIVVLEDLHAADPSSLLLFEFLAHAIGDVPILLVGTYQEGAARRRADVTKLLGTLARVSPTISLRGFGEEDLGVMVRHASGTSWPVDAIGRLHQATEGNPFFTAEIVRLLAGEGRIDQPASFPLPDTVRETVRRRFDPLGPSGTATLQAAAVIGREFRVATLEHVVPDPEGLLERLDDAAAAGLVTMVPGALGRFRFTHNLIRETLYADLSTARRSELHSAVGNAIEARHGAVADRLVELAHHFAHAGREDDVAKAVEYATLAGAEAMRLFAYEQAAELYQLALDASESLDADPQRRAELMLAWAVARARSDHIAGREALLAAADAARGLDDPRLFAEAGLAMRAWPRGSGVLDDQPSGVLTEALERLQDGDKALRARVLARLAVSLYYWPGTEERRTSLVAEASAIARELGEPETLAHVLSNGQYATWGPDNTERDLEWMTELIALAEDIGNDELLLAARNRQIDFLVELDDIPSAETALRELELTAPRSADPRVTAYAHLHRARHAIIAGRYPEAERLNREAARGGEKLRDPNLAGLVTNQLAGMLWAHDRIAELGGEARRVVETDVTAAWAAGIVLAAAEQGDEREARRELERLAANGFRDIPRYNGWLITIALLAEACVKLGDLQRAGQLYALLLPFAGRNVTTPQAIFAGPVSRFLGILAGALGERDQAVGHFAAAREAAIRNGALPVQLRVALDEAALLAGTGHSADRERALDVLAQAAPMADDLGVERLWKRVEQLCTGLGAERPAAPVSPREPHMATLRREGDMWAFEVGELSLRVRDGKGVRCLATLLANPGVEIHAMELAGGERAAETRVAADAGPVLDAEAKAAYRRRLEDLRETVAEAEAFNDPERAAQAREEMELLAHELAGAVGLGGRDRKAASSAERARVSVTKAIRSTIRRIGEHDANLGRELEATVKTGAFCVYEPDRRRPLSWRVE